MNSLFNINHQSYTKDNLIAACDKIQNSSAPSWEKEAWSFIAEWLDKSHYVKLKTSGSTGIPKEIKVEKKYMRNSALMTLDFLKLQAGDTALLCLSASYIAGKMMIVRALEGRLKLLIQEPTGNPLEGLNEPIDFAAMVPLQVEKVLEEEGQLENIKNLIIGGAAVSPTLAQKLKPLSNSIYSTYGMTETVSHIAMKRLSGNISSFIPMPGVTLSTDDRDCLVIDAPHLSADKVVTNDIVSLDDEGGFEFIGRYDNVINTGGVKVSPEAVEEKIAHLIDTRFFISSRPDDKLGEKVVLVIESPKGDGTDYKSAPAWEVLKKQIGKIVSPYECPKEVVFVERFEETKTGKIKRIF